MIRPELQKVFRRLFDNHKTKEKLICAAILRKLSKAIYRLSEVCPKLRVLLMKWKNKTLEIELAMVQASNKLARAETYIYIQLLRAKRK